MEQNQIEQPQVAPVKPEAEDGKMSKKGVIGMVIMTIIALAGVAFGVFGMVQSTEKDKQVSDLKVQIKEISGKVTEFTTDEIVSTDEDGTVTEITDTNVVANSEDYIYIGQWGIKIKIPDNLTITGYKYGLSNGYSSVSFWGNTKGGQYFPEFADINKGFSRGIISRYPKGTELNYGSAPVLIFSDDQFGYYYSHPQEVGSTDEGEQAWEVESVQAIQDMLTNPDNYSKI